ncbi:MAG: hypothetical protein IH866_05630 [Chloroflexi bacterium]|nr:hypothetical protein [Chloroflexota bacterium]
MNKRSPPFLIMALLVLTAGALLAAACDGDSTEAEPAMATDTPESTAVPTVTQEPAPTERPAPTATPQPPAPTATPLPPAPTTTYTPGPTCPPRTHRHLDIGTMRLQPGFTDAIITEIDADSIRIVVQGVELIITGSGKVIGIGGPGDPSRELLVLLSRAIDAANFYQC